MVPGTGTKLPYQCSRDVSSDGDDETLPYSDSGEACPDQVRQHDSCQLFQQARRYKISQSLRSNMAPFKVGQEATMHDHCYTSRRSNESEGRFLVKIQDLAHRVDAPSKAGAGDFQDLGETVDRPVCSRPKSPSANILCLASEQGGLCARRILSELGEFKCVCIPSNLSYSSSTETDGVSSISGNSDCTIVAQTGMVHEASGSAGRYSHNTTDSRQSAAPGQRAQQNISSQPTNVVLDGMETVQPQGSSGNLSERAQDLVEASLREGTRKDYLSKYGRYSDWCDQRGLHPSRAPLNEILNFLAHLQEQGYSYSTVCGYRSMLSAFHEPVHGDSVGSHPLVTRLIKGVFNTNPPNKKLCQERDVGVVLKYLSGEPIIPFESCSLKFLTMKACFLLAITSARRTDDISKLSMMPGQCRFMKDKLLLIPDDLLKQDRPSHYLPPLEIERYDNLNICAVHTLEKYLQVVENLRRQVSSLFLTVIRPHKKPTSQTISRWITEVMRLAYEKAGKPLAKVNAHSTRGMATSWAEFKGASIPDILRMADWSSAKTYCDHYRYNMGSKNVSILSCSVTPGEPSSVGESCT